MFALPKFVNIVLFVVFAYYNEADDEYQCQLSLLGVIKLLVKIYGLSPRIKKQVTQDAITCFSCLRSVRSGCLCCSIDFGDRSRQAREEPCESDE
jgi:hypothetical protein